jgi:hypothetical protein
MTTPFTLAIPGATASFSLTGPWAGIALVGAHETSSIYIAIFAENGGKLDEHEPWGHTRKLQFGI